MEEGRREGWRGGRRVKVGIRELGGRKLCQMRRE